MPNNHDFFDLSSPGYHANLVTVVLVVTALHLTFIGLGLFWETTPPPPKVRNKVLVQTVRLNPNQTSIAQNNPIEPPPIVKNEPIAEAPTPPMPISEPVKEEKPVLPPKPQPKSESKPEPAPPPKPKPVKPKSKPKPKTPPPPPPAKEAKKPVPPKTPPPVKKQVDIQTEKNKKAEEAEKKKAEEAEKKRQVEKAEAEKKKQKEREEEERKQQAFLATVAKTQEKLAKMSESRGKINAHSSVSIDSTAIPKELGELQIDALPMNEGRDWGAQELSYREKVASHLKKALRLPDFGAVAIKLTVTREGKVIKVETTQSENSKNKAYIEREVMLLQFPRFGQEFGGAKEQIFQFHLHNDA